MNTPAEQAAYVERTRAQYKATCVECGRVFDLTDDDDAQEWAYGHDCE